MKLIKRIRGALNEDKDNCKLSSTVSSDRRK